MPKRTIAELIAELQQYPGDTHVVVDGYEGGYDDIASFDWVTIRHEKSAYFGSYDQAREGGHRALVLSRP